MQPGLLRFGRAASGESGIGRAGILMLRKLNVLHRKAPKRVAFTNVDRLVFAGLYRLVLDAVKTLELDSTSAGGGNGLYSRR